MRSLTMTYLDAVARLNRRVALAESERDAAWEVVASLREDIAELETDVAGWRRRAEVLYDACSPELRDGVLGVVDTIEQLDEVEDR